MRPASLSERRRPVNQNGRAELSEQDYKIEIRDAVMNREDFQRLTLGSPLDPRADAWQKITLRPVMLQGRRQVQIAFYAGKKHVTRNAQGPALAREVQALLDASYSHLDLQCSLGDVHVRITRKGKALVSRGKPSKPDAPARLEHNRPKQHLLPADKADPLLSGLGIMTPQGTIRAAMYPKFRQINEFLRVIEQVAEPIIADLPQGRPLHIVDCGCGNAYLTFAAYHWLRDVRKTAVKVTGVDSNGDLVANCRKLAGSLGWEGLEFVEAAIADYAPAGEVDLVVSLHACDTATDQALGRAVAWSARCVLAAPCCQHELHNQLKSEPFVPLLRHGVLKERLADLLTDALRASALRAAGYRSRVFEFISPEHTAKNLMLAAERIIGPDSDRQAAWAEYVRLRDFWAVSPCIEKALAGHLPNA